jgi:hypothetical protein
MSGERVGGTKQNKVSSGEQMGREGRYLCTQENRRAEVCHAVAIITSEALKGKVA